MYNGYAFGYVFSILRLSSSKIRHRKDGVKPSLSTKYLFFLKVGSDSHNVSVQPFQNLYHYRNKIKSFIITIVEITALSNLILKLRLIATVLIIISSVKPNSFDILILTTYIADSKVINFRLFVLTLIKTKVK